METKIDSLGRIVIPKPLRDALRLTPGTPVDISIYGMGLQIVPGGRTARLEKRGGRLVGVSDTVITDDDVFRLLDEFRK